MNRNIEELPTKIESTTRNLANLINQYSREQVDDWRKVPYLALMTEGRPDFMNNNWLAYDHGLWLIPGSDLRIYSHFFVNLLDGNLVEKKVVRDHAGQTGYSQVIAPADPKNVIKFVGHLEMINAKALVSMLENKLDVAPNLPKDYITELDAWRWKKVAELNLGREYNGSPQTKERIPHPYFAHVADHLA